MSRRWAWWTAAVLLFLVILASGAWRISREIPDRLRKAEESIREAAAGYGLRISFRDLRFHLLYPHLSLEDLEITDDLAGTQLLRAGNVDISLSPGRLLAGESPVSRIRIRNFSIRAGEENRPLFDKVRKAEGKGPLPEILLLDGIARIGPMGALKRWEGKIPELRIRDVKFLGTRVFIQAEEATGEVEIPGAGAASWPFASMEAELFDHEGTVRLRKFRASGPFVAVRASGNVLYSRRSGDLNLSGTVDVAKAIASGVPGSAWAGKLAGKGILDFSVAATGTLDEPGGSGRLVLREGMLRGDIPAEFDLAVSLSGGKFKLESLKGKVSGGDLSGSGMLDIASGEGEGKFSLVRASFFTSPFAGWGLAWRPAGMGDTELAVSTNRERVRATLSLRYPAGLERVEGGKRTGEMRLPLSASATADYHPGGEIRIAAMQLGAGGASLSGSGEIDAEERTIRLDGDFSVPQGRAGDYGWDYPVSWGRISGEWEAAGAASRPHVAMRLEAREFQARSLPPVPVVIRLEGDPMDAVHFVADVPASAAKATATGTVISPLSASPFGLEAAIAVRDIDLSESGIWIRGIVSSLGKDPAAAVRRSAGLSGTGTADLHVSAGGGNWSFSGSLRSAAPAFRGVGFRDVSVQGSWSRGDSAETWKGRAEGRIGSGSFLFQGIGRDSTAEITVDMDGVDLGDAVAVAASRKWSGVRGAASARISARYGGGWVVDAATVSVPGVTIDGAVLEGVSGEGSLGAEEGRFSLSARSPAVRMTANVRRGGVWPMSVRLEAKDVPTGILLSAAGRPGTASGGKWSAEAEGVLKGTGLSSDRIDLTDAISGMRFSVSAESPSVSGIAFGELRASGRKEGDAVTGEIRSSGPDSRIVYSLGLKDPIGFRMEGPFSFSTEAGVNGAGEGKARFALTGDAEIAGSLRAIGNTSGTLRIRDLNYRNGGLELSGKDIRANLSPEGVRWAGGTLLADGNPLNLSGKISWQGDMDVRLDGKVPAGAIRLLTDVFDRLDGTARLDVRVAGKWNDPQIAGNGRLDGGVLSFKGYAQLFEDMQVDALISREKIVFEHFEGRSGGGYIDGRGELPLRFGAHQRLFFTVDFFDMRFPYPDDFRPVLQGHLELIGPYDDFLVTGDVEVQSARYTKTLRPEKVLVDFRRRLADVTARKEKSDFRVRLDVNGVADGTIRIKNNLADAEAKGEFKVVGDAAGVIILGAFDVIEGFVEYRGNRYELKRVGVEFQDPRRNNPRLDARAETRKGNVTVIVSVTGTLEKYEVDLSSDPPLSKNDIVSLLSLGVTSQALAGSEGTVGAAAASSIVLGPYKGRVEEEIRGIVKLDKFAIEPSFSPTSKSFEPNFIVGKSFGEKLSVSVSTSVGTTTESSAKAEYKLLENVYLQGAWESETTDRHGDIGADVKVRYRYRQFKDFLRGHE